MTPAEERHQKLLAQRDKPSRTDDELTVDIIDAIATMCQLLNGRNLDSPAVLDALEDLVDNGEVAKVYLEIFKNKHGRRSVKL